MSVEVFEKQFAHFRHSTEYRFIAYDPRSKNRSTQTMKGDFYEQHARDLNMFIENLGLKQVVLGGWSNGAFTALSYIQQFGVEKFSALVAIDGAPSSRVLDNKKEWSWFRKDDEDSFLESFTQGVLVNGQRMNTEFAR